MMKRQFGLTLIELSIALALGLVLTTAMVQIYIGSTQTYFVGDSTGQVQDVGRSVLNLIEKATETSGYRNQAGVLKTFNTNFPTENIFDEGQVVSLKKDQESLTLSTRFQGDTDALITDCFGVSHTEAVTQTLKFNLQNQTLVCSVSGAPGETVLHNIEQIQIHAGIDTDEDFIVNKYIPPEQTTKDDWRHVLALKVALLTVSDGPVHHTPVKKTFQLLNEEVYAFNDRKLRKVFKKTFHLKNRLP